VRRRGGIGIARKGTDATGAVLCALLGEEAEVTVAGGFKLAVGHGGAVVFCGLGVCGYVQFTALLPFHQDGMYYLP
jgi:hypothetical protein